MLGTTAEEKGTIQMSDILTRVTTARIYPAIGIARVGNSPSEFWIGPERVGETSAPKGGFKDAQGRIKRQAARFRIFGYDNEGHLVQEITQKDASITWTVHLANKKAAFKQFKGLDANRPLRNAAVRNRASLVIDPGPRRVGPHQSASFDTGTFMGQRVPLGDIRTDEDGRLIVLGGFGDSKSPAGKALPNYANNNGWYDDVSDGPVSAQVRINGTTTEITAAGAWVIVGPPDFAPPVGTTTTLYDTLVQKTVRASGFKVPERPSFTKDIYPILARTVALKWVSEAAGDFHDFLSSLIPPPGDPDLRSAVFKRLRHPSSGSGGDMPKLLSDTEEENETVTEVQHAMMKKWSDGDFVNDWKGSPVDPEITPEGLTRAALDTCVGGPFYPGIEAGWLLRDVYTCSEPFRLDHTHVEAGDVTKQMALPWQADFYDCQSEGDFGWWPSQRPDAVFPETGGPQVPWTRDLVNSKKDMVEHWWELGIVAARGDRCVETERKR
ncbi:MAG: LodA/GoxA family CTQ-dependent oxidase [Acidobacteriota bacterium]